MCRSRENVSYVQGHRDTVLLKVHEAILCCCSPGECNPPMNGQHYVFPERNNATIPGNPQTSLSVTCIGTTSSLPKKLLVKTFPVFLL